MGEEVLARKMLDAILDRFDAETVAQVTDAQYQAALTILRQLIHEDRDYY